MPILPEDEALLSGVAIGETSACTRFDQRFRPWLVSLLQRYGLSIQDSQDIAQVCLIAAFKELSVGSFQGQSSFEVWLIGILRHKLADHWRSERGRHGDRPIVSSLDSVPADGDTVSAIHRAVDTTVFVKQILSRMPSELRFILIFNLVGGYTIEQLATQLGHSKKRVWEMLGKAKRLFRRLVEESEKLPPGEIK